MIPPPNIGPKADGSVPAESVQAMQAIGEWMKGSGESVYGTTAGPFEKLAWGRCTKKRGRNGRTRLYLHVFDWPADGKLTVPVAADSSANAFLVAGRKKLAVTASERGTAIAVGNDAPDKIATVVVLEINGPPKVV